MELRQESLSRKVVQHSGWEGLWVGRGVGCWSDVLVSEYASKRGARGIKRLASARMVGGVGYVGLRFLGHR